MLLTVPSCETDSSRSRESDAATVGCAEAVAGTSPVSKARGLTTAVITSVDEFSRLQCDWDQLLDDSNQRVYFMRWRWNLLWWRHFAPSGSELRILTCRDADGALVGLAPFYLRRHQVFRVFQVRELSFLGTGVGTKTSEYLNIAARRGEERSVALAMAAALKQRADWDRIRCQLVPADSNVLQVCLAAAGENIEHRTCDQSRYIDTSRGWGHYKRGLGRSMRRNVEYYGRRMFKRYPCEFRRVESEAELEPALDALIRLHVAQWEAKGQIGSLANPQFARFVRDAARHSLCERRLRLWTLKIGGSIQAVLVGFLDNGILHYFQSGHSPAYSREDLGTVILALCVRDCCDDPEIRAFDFMGGGAAYKALWARDIRDTVLCEVSRLNANTLAFDVKYGLKRMAQGVYRAVVPTKLRAARRAWLRAHHLRIQRNRIAVLLLGCIDSVNRSAVDLWADYAGPWSISDLAWVPDLVSMVAG